MSPLPPSPARDANKIFAEQPTNGLLAMPALHQQIRKARQLLRLIELLRYRVAGEAVRISPNGVVEIFGCEDEVEPERNMVRADQVCEVGVLPIHGLVGSVVIPDVDSHAIESDDATS